MYKRNMAISENIVTKFTNLIELVISSLYTESVSKSGVSKSISKKYLTNALFIPRSGSKNDE